MPDDVGGTPFPNGDEPDDRSHGEANDEFAAVVFDEDFVRSALIHEPTAVERILAAAEASRRRPAGVPPEDELFEDGYGADGEAEFGYDPDGTDPDGRFGHGREMDGLYGPYGPYGRYGSAGRPYRGHARWQRPVAWLLAVLMGVGVVALAFTAVYRGASGNRQDPAPPPATSGVDGSPTGPPRLEPSASSTAESEAPPASTAPRSP